MKKDGLRDTIAKYSSDACESPIEKLLLGALYYQTGLDLLERSGAETDLSGARLAPPFFVLKTQHPIGSFRADIALVGPHCLIAVECDGHAFHEKTKEQAARDKARDREITSAGYALLRFTGAEIWNDPFACAEQVLECAHGQWSKAAEAAYMARKEG